MADVTVHGLVELHKLLQSLPARIEANVLAGALRAGQQVVRRAAIQAAPIDSGALRKSIRVRVPKGARKRGLVRVDVVAGDATAWYAHLIEFGTGSHYEGRGRSVRKPYVIKAKDQQGKRYGPREKRRINHGSGASALYFQNQMVDKVVHPGIKPDPYMRDAAKKLDNEAVDAFVAYVRKRLPKEVEKHAGN